MKLKQRPTVYNRLDLLLKHSKKFLERLGELYERMDDKNEEELVVALADEFCLFEGVDDAKLRKDVLFELGTHIDSILKLYGAHDYWGEDHDDLYHYSPKVDLNYRKDNDVLVIVIKAPTTKAEMLKHWSLIALKQRNFLLRSPGDGFHAAKKMGSPEAKRFSELTKKNVVRGEQLSEEEISELGDLLFKLETRNIFKESPKQQLDEDIFILRLARDYGDGAELEYYRRKLIEWLKTTKHQNVSDDLSFHETCRKHCPDFMGISFDAIRKTIHAKNFEQRLTQARMAFGLL